MRTSTLITLLVVGGSGVAAFILAYGYLGQQADPNAGKVPVLTALGSINRGDTLELGKNCEFRMIAQENIPEDAIVQEEKALIDIQNLRYVAFTSINRNDILKKSSAGANITGLIEQKLKEKKGYQALSITVSTDRAVAGFIKPGSYVDLWWTGRMQGKSETNRRLLSAVEVAAVDLENTAGSNVGGKEVRYMTFFVKPEQVQILLFATQNGNGQVSASLVTPASKNGEKVMTMDWQSFQAALEGNEGGGSGGSTGGALAASDRKVIENDGMSLLNAVEAALRSPEPANTDTSVKVPVTAVSVPKSQVKGTWYIFEVKNIDGKTVTKVPVSGDSKFAKNNKGLLRAPEPEELEAIRNMPAENDT
jgi:pilus assembly protein CpaB